ncbi:mediator complex subunit 13 C-terminal-domain-containing protein [Multifurca ochricompacta]|uniref:Mediator of RNA polymerase II transcription subunit 13 n=1 Tax=Multifurca ochricompacta TaxID=376703 RepID=A0AAD4M515_9AGAM|nr:mediator complex subunit 13 C-terminal-domain-containing protein [Multifurca ochricompacta]
MTSKPPVISPGSSGSVALAQHPLSIDTFNKLLSSSIPLPPNASIVYAVFSPTTSPALHADTVELARRRILDSGKLSLSDSLLCTVHVEKGTLYLYVFSIVSSDGTNDRYPFSTLSSLQFDGLISSQVSSFRPTEIHEAKSTSLTRNRSSTPQSHLPSPHAIDPFPCLFPAESLRIPYSLFVKAVQERLINDICSVQDHDRRLCRLNGGFLIFPQHPTSDWGTGWEHHAQNRYAYSHPTIASSDALYSRFPISPLPSGTPIILLPYGTPAYYLTSYNGPTAGLTAQFTQSLSGLGCESWAALASKPPSPPILGTNTGCHTTSRDPRFLIAWIDVQNKQGEDKGLTVIWPISLALSFLPSSSSPHASRQLSHVPDLPSQLQPSPPPPTAAAGPVIVSLTAAAFAASPIAQLGRSPQLPSTPIDLPPAITRRPNVPRVASYTAPYNPTTNNGLSSFYFNPDSSSRDDIRALLARLERERERERLRREREISGPSIDASPARAMSAVNTPGSVGISSPMSTTLMGTMNSPPTTSSDLTISSIIAPAPQSAPLSAGADPPLQPFYPSPPQSSSVPLSSVEMVVQPLSASSTLVRPFAPPLESSAPAIPSSPDAVTFSAASAPVSSFDAFPGFENWTQDSTPWQSSGGILDMPLGDVSIGVDMDIDSLPYNVDPIAGGGSGRGWETSDMGRMDIDGTCLDSIFTEADFDFWDDGKPQQSSISSAPAPVPPPLSINSGTNATRTSGPTPLGISSQFFEDAKPSATVTSSHAPMWPPSALAGFTQQGIVLDVAAELISPSPTKTLSPPSGPATPRTVALDPAVRLTPRSPLAGGGIFDAIPFASTYRVTDGKYTAGKFALPSPPDEEDRTQSVAGLSPKGGRWWNRYHAATDPRVGVVRKLIGIKLKNTADGCAEPSEWVRGSQEWTRNVLQTPPPEESYALSEDSESGEEDEDENMQLDNDEDEDVTSPATGPRPFTPLPSYLPLGPTLLHTHFQHSLLLPLSTPLRPSRAAASPSGQTPGAVPVSVPTPVSPAALLGAASEKSRSLEAAAQILAKEVVESATWNDAWRANAVDCWTEHRCATGVWQADLRCVAKALTTLPGMEALLDLQTVFASEEGEKPVLEQLEPPFLSVAKSDALIQVLPTALRFWDKLGLSPRAGKKNVCAFVFFEESDEDRVDVVDKWLEWVGSTYTRHNLGEHERGKSSSCVKNGLVPVKFETFRKTLSSFVSVLPPSGSNYVFYIAMPSSAISISSQTLRQVFSAVKRAQKMHPEEQILFQFIPAQSVYSLKFSSVERGGVFAFACSIYNRILSPVDRVMSRQIIDNSLRMRDFFQEPAFSLARPLHTKVQFVRQFPTLSLDVVDRHTLLHIGYRFSTCGKWIFACCVDQRGEAHDLAVWLLPSESPETFIAQHLWIFAVNVAKRANVEWRIVIAKLGSMDVRELEAWVRQLDKTAFLRKELPMVHVSLVCVELDRTWAFIAPYGNAKRPTSESRSSKTSLSSFMVDASSNTYRLGHSAQMDLLPPSCSAGDFDPADSCISDCSDAGPPPYERHLRPLHTATLIRVPCGADFTSIAMLHLHQLHSTRSHLSSLTLSDADMLQEVCRNYHELSVLARSRWLKANPILPFHLGAWRSSTAH